MNKILCLLLTAVVVSTSWAQTDTARILYYNILDFPSGGASRADTMKKIFAYAEPDLILVNELETLFGANLILNSALNVDGVTRYDKAVFYNGTDTDNMLFYDSEKFELLEQFQIGTSLRDISEYHLYFKPSGADSVHFWAYSCHLKAGSWQSDEDQREDEAMAFKSYLDNKGRTGNIIVGGDFNFYTSAEGGCQSMLYDGSVQLKDPINLLGGWNNNSFYSSIHTQSTRTATGFAGGSSGGMDDRFDIIFTTQEVLDGSEGMMMVPGSYQALGQDGSHFNDNINDGVNTAVPSDIADALFYNSDHLPVMMDISFDIPVGIQQNETLIAHHTLTNYQRTLNVRLAEFHNALELQFFDLNGKLVKLVRSSGQDINVDISDLNTGLYLVKLKSDDKQSILRVVKTEK